MPKIENETVVEPSTPQSIASVKIPINLSDYLKWDVNNVVQWCISSLQIKESDVLCANILNNEITGDLLPDLSLDDCKDLCQSNESNSLNNEDETLKKAIQLKIMINKLKNSEQTSIDQEKLDEQQENMTIVLKNLYSTVTTKLQDYQSQYTQLRMDILDLVKNSDPIVEHTSTTSIIKDQVESDEATLQPQRPSMKHSGSSRRSHSSRPSESSIQTSQRRPETPVTDVSRPAFNNSHSMGNISTTETVSSPSHADGALKQLRASKDDSSEKILRSAMRRHNLNDKDWRQYVLVIGYGDQERILEPHENPVVVFKNLKHQGLHPTIMLRRRGDFEELQSGEVFQSNDDVTPGGRL